MKKLKKLIQKLLFVLFLLPALVTHSQPKTVLGIYGSPAPFWERNYVLSELGVNAVFVHSGSIDSAMVEKVKKDGLKIYAEFATLNGKDYLKDNPEAWPINEKGQKAEPASWFMGICPTNTGFRQYRMQQLVSLLKTFDLDGVWMDYVHWHAQFEEPEPILPETCFCNSCLTAFEKSSGVNVPEGSIPEKADWILSQKDPEWRDWRCEVIRAWSVEMKEILRREKPGALLGIYHCPWNDEEFQGARRRILGLDYDMLSDVVDVFSPMVYHGRMGREPEWVAENITWFCNRLKISGSKAEVWPIVQAYNNPEVINPEEFERVLKGGLDSGSGGVMMFTSYSVAEDPEKVRIMKKVYLKNGR
jgi:hypothetical protein